MKRGMGFLLAAALLFNTLPSGGLVATAAASERSGTGTCEHHPEHTVECGYTAAEEGSPCNHEHTDDCYIEVIDCTHEHDEDCYPQEDISDNDAALSDAEEREPENCPHICDEESGCITKELNCQHEHDDECGYAPATEGTPCGYVCEICAAENSGNLEVTVELGGGDIIEKEPEIATASNAVKTISEWSWNDEEEMLDPESHILALPGASAEQPAYFEDVVMLLPSSITADGEEIPVTWQCDTYPDDGAYEGSYVFTAILPEGYALAEDAAPLNVTVELGGVMLLAAVADGISYLDEDGAEQACESAIVVDSSTEWGTSGETAWYVVNSNVTIANRVTVSGDVHLILADGCTLTAIFGVNVPTGSSLVIYGQKNGTGTLIAMGGGAQAGIGGNNSESNGPVTINGGTVTAAGGDSGAGIGGGLKGSGSDITINGGTVTATSRNYGAGIGGGNQANGSDITINGGTVTATGGTSGAGIGGGLNGSGSDITISGGFVAAVGGSGSYGTGAAIGNGGRSGADGTETAESNFTNAVVLRQTGSSSTMTGQVYGTAVLDTDAQVPADAVLTVPESASLTLEKGMTLENSGTIYVDSELNFGGSTYGTLTGTDSVYYRLTVNGGSITAGTITYPATDGKTYAAEGASVTVAPEDKEGQMFFGWESSVSSVTVTDHSFTMPASPLILTASYQNIVNVSYLDYVNGSFEKKNAWAIPLTSDMTAWGMAGAEIWYVVNSDVTIASRIAVSGDVHLILADGYTLTASKGIGVPAECSLTVYGQESGTGALKAAASASSAGIGGNYGSSTTTDGNNGPITINGGTVTATGETYSAGIGGGNNGSGNNITINGGTVTATGGTQGAGIGGGYYGSGNNITINGGTVTATANSEGNGAGIGGGCNGGGSNITINGGTVTATGGKYGAGIGGGYNGGGSSITVSGGEVTASGITYGAGIGGGYKGSGSDIMISGGTVTATGGTSATGIGGGCYGSGNNITINGGTVTATGGAYCAGIGGGSNGTGSGIAVNGGEVTAAGGNYGAGIGGGYGRNGSNITISSGTVTATGGFGGAGIGGGYNREGSDITISGGTVTATGGSNGAGIGGGYYGSGSDITISGGFVTARGGSGSGNAGAAIGSGGVFGTDGTELEESNFTNAVVLRQSGSSSTMTGKVYGTAVLDTDATVPTDAALTVPESTSLTLQSGMTLTNSGTIYVDAELNFGGDYGTLTGTDSVYYWLTVVDGSATEGTVTYPDADGKTYAAEGASVTVAPDSKENQTFIGWETSITSVTVTNHSFTMPASPLTVTAKFGETTVSVDITWGAMSFTYTDGAWNPDTHTNGEGGWTDGGSGWISVENSGSNVPVEVNCTYNTARTDISGSFTDGTDPVSEPVTLAVDETKKLWLILSGKPDGELDHTELGTVTVKITGGGE